MKSGPLHCNRPKPLQIFRISSKSKFVQSVFAKGERKIKISKTNIWHFQKINPYEIIYNRRHFVCFWWNLSSFTCPGSGYFTTTPFWQQSLSPCWVGCPGFWLVRLNSWIKQRRSSSLRPNWGWDRGGVHQGIQQEGDHLVDFCKAFCLDVRLGVEGRSRRGAIKRVMMRTMNLQEGYEE